MKYSVYGLVTISCYCEVEADNVQAARDAAQELNMATLCHNACSDDPTEAWTIDELDGTPKIECIEEVPQ